MTEHYVQCCGSNYGAQGLAMHKSLLEHCGDFRMTWVCTDDWLIQNLFDLDPIHCTLVHIRQLEVCIPGLKSCRSNRTEREWFWTLASQATWWALKTYRTTVTYLDSDLYFFGNPQPLHFFIGDTAMFDHRFPDIDGKRNPQYGRALYNVGWNSFRYSKKGLKCARWWAEKTREKCSETMPAYPEWGIPPGRAGDQAYLEGFNKLCDVEIIDNPRGNWAPYNVPATFDELPIFYHFHEWRSEDERTGYHLSDEVIERIYKPYEAAVKEAAAELWQSPSTT